MLTRMKGEISNNTIIVGDFNTPLTPMDRSTKQKINKETQTLNDTIDQLDLIDIYRTFHPKTMNFTFFSSAHGTFSRIDHILGHKSSLGKFRKTEIIPRIFLTTLQYPHSRGRISTDARDALGSSRPGRARGPGGAARGWGGEKGSPGAGGWKAQSGSPGARPGSRAPSAEGLST